MFGVVPENLPRETDAPDQEPHIKNHRLKHIQRAFQEERGKNQETKIWQEDSH